MSAPIRHPGQLPQVPNNQRPNNQQPRQQQPAPGQVPQQQPRPNPNDNRSNQNRSQEAGQGQNTSSNYPGPEICGEPRTVPVRDEVLQMSYQLVLPCGGSSNQAIQDRRAFESAQTLANNVAARLQQNSFMNRMQQAVRSQRISGQVSEATQSPSYWDHFINPEIPTWRRMLAGALLPLAGPLTLLGSLQGCGTVPDLPREVPEASVPPSDNDPACDGRRSQILSNDPLSSFRTGSTGIDAGVSDAGSTSGVQAELNRQFPGITLPELSVLLGGRAQISDSSENLIRSIQTSDPVSFSRIGDRLFVLTANRISGGYAPATLLVYDVSSMPPRPVPTQDFSRDSRGGPSNAIVILRYNPVAMASMVGNTEIGILFAAPSAGAVATIDPFSLLITSEDWCTTHAAPRSDGGVSDASRDSSSDASMSIDASIDASNNDASTDSRDASSDSRSDASVDSSSDARDAGSDSRSDASVDAPRG